MSAKAAIQEISDFAILYCGLPEFVVWFYLVDKTTVLHPVGYFLKLINPFGSSVSLVFFPLRRFYPSFKIQTRKQKAVLV